MHMNVLLVVVIVFSMLLGMIWIHISTKWMNYKEALKECFTGFYDSDANSLSSVVMIFGSTLRADNVYMNMARCMNKPILRNRQTVNEAVAYTNYGILIPVLFAFLLNMIMLSIASE